MKRKLLLAMASIMLLTQPLAAKGRESIDSAIEQRQQGAGITPSEICSDEVFIRRTYLILANRLPSIEQSQQFLDSKSKSKRRELIDELLASDYFVDMQSLRWSDLLKVKSEFPSNIWPNGVQAYNRWIYKSISDNIPYNVMVKDLLSATGSNFRTPQVSFYRAFVQRTPEAIADNIELLFLGRRKADAASAQFFSQIAFKSTGEWKEEIVYIDLDKTIKEQSVTMSDGTQLTLTNGRDLRTEYIEWLTSPDNRQFARAMANRIWYWAMGHGVVDEPDDFRASNPPANPELLELLTDKFIKSNYNVKALYREILLSDAYQRSSLSTPENRELGIKLAAYYPTTRLTAEQIIDGLSIITGINDRYVSRVPEPYSYYPADMLSSKIGDATVSSPQLDLFGRPSRDYSLESQRSNAINSKQVLYLLNSSTISTKISKSTKIKEMLASCASPEESIEKIYLMMLSRRPTTEEMTLLNKSLALNNPKSYERLIWALLNSTEYIYNH